MQLISNARAFGGEQRVYRHRSSSTGTDMDVAVFLPEEALRGELCPTLFYLSGLTCTWENVTVKGGAQRPAADHGMIFIAPDTSPRGEGVADDEAYDLGQGAGFYVNATQEPWAAHFRMEDYVARELPKLLAESLPVDADAIGVTGHSMGGHGALTLAMRHPDVFRSLSAFAPITNPLDCPWGHKALGAYLGEDRAKWAEHDACELARSRGFRGDILIDQGQADGFLEEQLKPWAFDAACREAGIDLTLRLLGGYDHSYYFISTFMEDHVAWHAQRLFG
ncbi:S-formylglutathione hydrolase [Stappia sp. GBMRC 2046]|uniref:S-formylglutathione hydrolase n=1 Tax=Stappia sediminis TaxID=2692190 RepID=A0A7X3LR37_9HYPH|nr:S-formylglutathione hydrolase [Stappia sediminis]MXN63552.1 S-formylglutathione hydrolase [Stappia sediminis]